MSIRGFTLEGRGKGGKERYWGMGNGEGGWEDKGGARGRENFSLASSVFSFLLKICLHLPDWTSPTNSGSGFRHATYVEPGHPGRPGWVLGSGRESGRE